MNIIFHIPHTNTIYAGRSIANGYKNAFLNMGHNFCFLSSEIPNQTEFIDKFSPDIIMMSLGRYPLKYLDKQAIIKARKQGTKVFVNTPFWKSPLNKNRVNESKGVSEDAELLNFITKYKLGDVYYNVCEYGDERMDGFEKATGYKHHTIPLAADSNILLGTFVNKFKADVSYLGTNLSQKRYYFKEMLFPLGKKYNLKLYGQDWGIVDKSLGWIQRGGQYFNIPILKSIQKPKFRLEDEANIYRSSTISVNIHEDYQRKYGGDCNERTFKIPFSGGFEITDDVACIKKYFKEGDEIIIAKDKMDWFDKIDYYVKNPNKRLSIIEAGRKRVAKSHTYNNRVELILDIYKTL